MTTDHTSSQMGSSRSFTELSRSVDVRGASERLSSDSQFMYANDVIHELFAEEMDSIFMLIVDLCPWQLSCCNSIFSGSYEYK